MILDLGCGTAKVTNSFGIDNAALPGVDLVHNLLTVPYPLPEGCASEIYLNHVVEHFAIADYQAILCEAYRLLQPNGILHIRVPHIFSIAAWVDPTHKSAFTFQSAQFWTPNAHKSYYVETLKLWQLERISTRVTWFDWKRYRLRKIDQYLSNWIARFLNWLLQSTSWPMGADWFVRAIPMYFVEICWDFKRAETS